MSYSIHMITTTTTLLCLLFIRSLSSVQAWQQLPQNDRMMTFPRREFLSYTTLITTTTTTTVTTPFGIVSPVYAATNDGTTTITTTTTTTPMMEEEQVIVQLTGDAKRIFGEGRALELQGNLMAAQRLYNKVTQMVPNFVYGWSSLGNTQTAFGDLVAAEESYTKSIQLCTKVNCNDQYVLYLNRGTIRLNTNRPKEALIDLREAATLRGRPDDIVLQNLARACELNGLYEEADRNYDVAIRMSANQVSPYWLRSAMVKFQLNDQQGYDLLKRIENRFPDAPEVKAASAVFLARSGKMVEAQQKFLEISDRQRLKFVDPIYVTQTIAWPPAMLSQLSKITQAVGDGSVSI